MIQQAAFSENNKMLKGALHCHTTRSDGWLTPAENMALHFNRGYDFMAITDHLRYNLISHDAGIPITVIPGVEYNSHDLVEKGHRVYHNVFLGPAEADGNGFRQDEMLIPITPMNSPEDFQAALDDAHTKNNITFFCHPQWSFTNARYFETLKGNFAMEIWNSGSVIEHDLDTDAAYWDELLGQGIRIFGVATDDDHSEYYSCFGWVMVNAQNNVNAILNALKNGAFYSTCGPQIYDFYVDGEWAHVKCSDVDRIRLHSDKHPTQIVRSQTEATINQASFYIGNNYDYIRATIVDRDGRKAWTNPIFLNELQ